MAGGRLPVGTATFVMTDVVGSTPIWEGDRTAARDAFARHDAVIAAALDRWGGHRPKDQGEGDSVFAVFETVRAAIGFAVDVQRELAATTWPGAAKIEVRVALHTGEAELVGDNYKGSAVHRCARLRALAHGGQIVLSSATAALLRTALDDGLGLRDLGTHELRGLRHDEHVFQLDVAGLEVDFPPLRSLSNPAVRHNLPQATSSFIGRDRETEEVGALLNRHRLVTVVGPGGTGKTRLAIQVASELVDGRGDGVWLAELAPVADPDLVAATVANVLHVDGEPGRPLLESVIERLSHQRLALVLDNCEHVIDAAAKLTDRILHSCPQVAVLATSREPLAIAGEHVYRLSPLEVPDAGATSSEDLLGCDSVALFVSRATAQQPSFVLDDSNAPAVASICRRLDGIPLAIELAAARMRVLPARDIAARLGERFRLLAGGDRAALPRQQTLRAMIDWSYDLLNASEQAVFRRLWVFAGSFDVDAAEVVAASDHVESWEVLDALTSLADKSLVEPVSDAVSARYTLLETVREYARERFVAAVDADVAALLRRHRDHYLTVAEQCSAELRSAHPAAAKRRLDTEYENLRLAIATSLDDPDAEPALRLAWALYHYWYRTRNAEGLETFTGLVEHPAGRDSAQWFPRAAASLSTLAHDWDLSIARRYGQIAREALAVQPDAAATVELQYADGGAALRRGDFATAVERFDQTAALARDQPEQWYSMLALYGRARALFALGQVGDALALSHEGLARLGEHDESWFQTGLHGLAAYCAMQLEDLDTALAHIEAACGHAAKIGDDFALDEYSTTLASVRLLRGDLADARATLDRVAASAFSKRVQMHVAMALAGYACVSTREHDLDRAARLHGAASAALTASGRSIAGEADAVVHADDRDHLRAELGADRFEALFAEGAALSVDEALGLARGADA